MPKMPSMRKMLILPNTRIFYHRDTETEKGSFFRFSVPLSVVNLLSASMLVSY